MESMNLSVSLPTFLKTFLMSWRDIGSVSLWLPFYPSDLSQLYHGSPIWSCVVRYRDREPDNSPRHDRAYSREISAKSGPARADAYPCDYFRVTRFDMIDETFLRFIDVARRGARDLPKIPRHGDGERRII